MLAALGGGCAIALIIIGALGAMLLRAPTGLLPAAPTESYSESTRAAQDILINQPVTATPMSAPAPPPSGLDSSVALWLVPVAIASLYNFYRCEACS